MSPVSDAAMTGHGQTIVVIADDYGDELIVVVAAGSVGLSAAEPGVVLNGAKLDKLRELLGRAAVPGVTSGG